MYSSIFNKLGPFFDINNAPRRKEPLRFFIDRGTKWASGNANFEIVVTSKLPTNVEVLSETEDELLVKVRKTEGKPWEELICLNDYLDGEDCGNC